MESVANHVEEEHNRLRAALHSPQSRHMADVTRILKRIEEGDEQAADQLLPFVCDKAITTTIDLADGLNEDNSPLVNDCN